MSRDKQIEEMAKVICLSYGKGVCRQCHDYEDCQVTSEAERLYNAGYRKASEVEKLEQDVTRLVQEKDALIKNYAECMRNYAREIFEDIFYHTYYEHGRPIIEHSTLLALQKKYGG